MEYKLLGKEEFDCVCQFCHKKQIGMSYVVECEDGEIKRFGSTCVKKALKITSSKFREMQLKEAEAFIQKILRAFPGANDFRKIQDFSFKRFGLI